ncbi:MAG: hypothetical protein RR988_05235 [Clostridia bacterium]
MNKISTVGLVFSKKSNLTKKSIEEKMVNVQYDKKRIKTIAYKIETTKDSICVLFEFETKPNMKENYYKITSDLNRVFDHLHFDYAFYTEAENYKILDPEAVVYKGLKTDFEYVLKVYRMRNYDKLVADYIE